MHLNDVETFPSDKPEGVFEAGDIMVSLRNIHTILVFRREDLRVTQRLTGSFVRQHDPDFLDGNTISIYDNYNISTDHYTGKSRILIHSFAKGKTQVFFEGSEEMPFYSCIMGKNQWLPNGNLLVTESFKGRALEIDSDRKACVGVCQYRQRGTRRSDDGSPAPLSTVYAGIFRGTHPGLSRRGFRLRGTHVEVYFQ